MTWAAYGEFLAFATVLVLIPGPDFAVVTRRGVRRAMDGLTGAVLLGFSARLAAEHA